MTIDEMKAKRDRALARLKPLEDGADHETMADAYQFAFDLVEDALHAALKMLEQLNVAHESLAEAEAYERNEE